MYKYCYGHEKNKTSNDKSDIVKLLNDGKLEKKLTIHQKPHKKKRKLLAR